MRYPQSIIHRTSGTPKPADSTTATDKQLAAEVVGRMPETATLEEISERLAILAGIRRGERDIAEGRTVTHEEAQR